VRWLLLRNGMLLLLWSLLVLSVLFSRLSLSLCSLSLSSPALLAGRSRRRRAHSRIDRAAAAVFLHTHLIS
jgi:threonine/homoserine/homoserine lactone efflux protein